MSDVNLSWDAPSSVNGVTGYMVYYGQQSHAGIARPQNPGVDASPYTDSAAVAGAGTLSTMITGLQAGTTYYFRVASVGSAPNVSSVFSNETSTVTEIAGPTNLRVT